MSTNILESRSSALSLESMMIHIERQGEGIDTHRICTFDQADKTIQLRRHLFDRKSNEQSIALSHRLVSWSEPWISEVRFVTDHHLQQSASRCFICINRVELYTTMFYAEGADLSFGPFFSRSSKLRSSLQKYVESLYDQRLNLSHAGQGIWRTIQNEGGLTALLDVWNDLYESTIQPQMLLTDPFCFD